MAVLNETLNVLPPEARQEVIDFVEFLAQKCLKKQSKMNHSKKEVLNFAGAWKDMDENDYQSFINKVYEKRKIAFTKRWKP